MIAEWLPLALVGIAALVYAVRTALELTGKSPGAELLRKENADLLRRNGELEQTVQRHEALIASLQKQCDDLKRSDQAAVLVALKEHEFGAIGRAKETHRLQEETNVNLDRILVVLETQTAGGTP